MYLVFKDQYGDFKWNEKFEIDSIESFVERANKRVSENGTRRDLFFADPPQNPYCVKEYMPDGKFKGTYYPCDKDIHRLI